MSRTEFTPVASVRSVWRLVFGCLALCCSVSSFAFKPEVGDSLDGLPLVEAGGRPVDWKALNGNARIIIFGASWCQPCQELRAVLPIELKRLREEGVKVDAFFVEVDDFDGATQHASPEVDRFGYVTLVPDPKRIDLSHQNPRGVKNWGSFSIYGFPTTFLLDTSNRVLGRYRGGITSLGSFNDARAVAPSAQPFASKSAPSDATPTAIVAPARHAVALPNPLANAAEEELLGVWKMTITNADIPAPPYLRVVSVAPASAEGNSLEASLSRKLSAWAPIAATCACNQVPRTIHLTTHTNAQVSVTRQEDGSFVGSITYAGKRHLVRAVRLDRVDTDDVEL